MPRSAIDDYLLPIALVLLILRRRIASVRALLPLIRPIIILPLLTTTGLSGRSRLILVGGVGLAARLRFLLHCFLHCLGTCNSRYFPAVHNRTRTAAGSSDAQDQRSMAARI